jgi:hypothetical protein
MTDVAEPDQDGAAAGEDAPSYAYKPSLVGAPSVFALGPDALHWQVGRRSGRVRYDRVRRVRMSYRPATMQSHCFLTEIWSDGNPKIQIASASWRSMVEQQRLDDAYTSFIAELHRRIASAGAHAQFLAGAPAAVYWLGVAVFAAVMVAMVVVVVVRATQIGQWTGAGIVGLFFAVFVFQLGNYFRRNRPGRYRPDELPAAVLPRGK